ncbi:TonB-dependent receptor [Mucilaginibacter paludis]|uniref:TonB-dependent siderophore receptor n=1 Tax=Mucilaginibacter paludis DSM 18603 TaxID=714943 RepID=H1Y3Y9_9SPHI|nr:TonB-dependent receptor [Mucilaginibacter paludis]EHQ30934.1 TonB-dependent siderophore receptor [Mucilaginibacter paludis DSM 18603]
MNSSLWSKNIYFTFLLVLASVTAFAQTGTIKGTIKTSDGQPAAAITIGLLGTTRGTITDEQGHYQLTKIKAGTYTLKLSAIGLIGYEQPVKVVGGQTLVVNLSLKQDARQLADVVISANHRLKFGDKTSDMVARMPLANLENPQVYSVISSELLREQNIVDYKTAMRNASGTSTIAQAGNGRSYTMMRGFITGNWMRNGLAAYQFSAIDPANIDRIEVIKGPSGTLFSSSVISYGGLINRVTKKPLDTAFTELSYTGGSFGLNRVTADVNTPLSSDKKVLFRLNAAADHSGNFQDAGFEHNYFIAPSLTYKASNKLTFNFEAELYQRHTGSINGFNLADNTYWAGKSYKDIPLDYNRSYQGNDIDTKLTNYNIYLQANYQFSKQWKSQTLFTLNGVYAPHQMFLDKYILDDHQMIRQVGLLSDKYHQTEIQQNFTGDVQLGGMRHRLLLGFDYTAYRQDPYYYVSTNFDVINYTQPGNFFVSRSAFDKAIDTLKRSPSDQNTFNSAVYFADVINITDRLNVLASVRIDHYDDHGSHDINTDTYTGAFSQTKASPKFGAVYQLIKGTLSAFANYQNGFSYTNAKAEDGKLFKPEQAFQYEGGFKMESANNKWSATLSYYDILVKDKLRTDPANTNFYLQDATQSSKGLEAELVANPVNGLNILLGYGYNISEFTKADADIQGKRPYGTPKHLINGWASYALRRGALKGFGLGFGGNYSSSSYGDDTDLVTVPSYVLLSSTAFYDRGKYRIGLKVDNLTNVQYWGPFMQPQPTRSYSLNLSYKFY